MSAEMGMGTRQLIVGSVTGGVNAEEGTRQDSFQPSGFAKLMQQLNIFDIRAGRFDPWIPKAIKIMGYFFN